MAPYVPPPAQHQELALLRPEYLLFGYAVGDTVDFGLTGIDDVLVVGRIIRHVAGLVLLAQPADPV